jgi:hypothetical protein
MPVHYSAISLNFSADELGIIAHQNYRAQNDSVVFKKKNFVHFHANIIKHSK